MKKAFIIFFLLSNFVVFISPEVIVMKDDRVINGKIIKMDEDTMTIITKTEEIVIEKEDVAKIYYSEKEYEKDKNENIKKEVSEEEQKIAANRLGSKLWHTIKGENKIEAIKLFDNEIELDPDNGYLYKLFGELSFWVLHDNEKTLMYSYKALEFIKEDKWALGEIYWLMGCVYAWNKNPNLDKALENYDKAIKISHNFPNTYRDRGDVFLKMGLFNNALEDLKRAKELDPDDGWGHVLLGKYYRIKNKFDDAIKECSQGIDLIIRRHGETGIDGWPYQELGELYIIKNRREDAINAFKISERLGNNWASNKIKELEQEEEMIKSGQLKEENIPVFYEEEKINDFAQPILDMISNIEPDYKSSFLKSEYMWPTIGGKTIKDGETNINIWVPSKNITLNNPKMNHKNLVLQLEVDLKNINKEIHVNFHFLDIDRKTYDLIIKIQKDGFVGSGINNGKYFKNTISSQIGKRYYELDSSQITLISFNNSYAIYINSDLLFGFYYKPSWESDITRLFVSYNKDYDIKKRKIEIPFKSFKIWDLDRIIK